MKKIVFVYIGLVIIVILLAAWRLGAFGFLGGLGGGKTAEVTIKGATVESEVADNDEKRSLGLGGRDSLDSGRGMLFVFDKKEIQTFWMLGMKFPIDIVFVDDDKIVDIADNVQPPKEDDPNKAALPLYRPSSPVNYVLEVPAGYSAEHEWTQGDSVEIKGL